MVLLWLACNVPGVMRSVLGLAGPVSLYCDWARQRVCSAIFFYLSVVIHNYLRSVFEIYTACYWDVRQ